VTIDNLVVVPGQTYQLGVALSLSVADGNRARRLYERAGFEPVELDDGGSWTMRLALAGTGGAA